MSYQYKQHKIQIRPSVTVDASVILDALCKDKPLGLTIEQLLEESPTYRKKKVELDLFKGK